jgi:ATP-dependent RNA circularization protein (DNA/RNA ligase family)
MQLNNKHRSEKETMQVVDSSMRDLSMKMEEGVVFKGRSSKQEMLKHLTAAPA